MGNRARIKKMLCQSGLSVHEKRRFFRGLRGKSNREKIAKGKLVAHVTETKNKKLSDTQNATD
jgi:hypothetical protein